MSDNDTRRAAITEILVDIKALHEALGEPVDPLDTYEARHIIQRIENRLRQQPEAQAAE